MKKFILVTLISVLITFALSFSVIAQDSTESKSKKAKIVLKIKKDYNGKTTVIDTTFTLSTPASHKEFDEYLKKHEEELDNLGKELENIEVFVDMPDFPDSMATDSLIKQLKFVGKGIRTPHFNWHNRSQGYDYDFEVPCPPDFPPPMHRNEGIERDYSRDHDMKSFHYENNRPTLSDILGDIPMDRVLSYSIKDRKNGKRIIIDLNDEPFPEKQDRVVIIREPGKQAQKRDHSDRQVKVIIKSDDGKQNEK
jgi:hypothetical protein